MSLIHTGIKGEQRYRETSLSPLFFLLTVPKHYLYYGSFKNVFVFAILSSSYIAALLSPAEKVLLRFSLFLSICFLISMERQKNEDKLIYNIKYVYNFIYSLIFAF